MTYGATYDAWCYNPLDQINCKSVKDLEPVWIFQTEKYESGCSCTPMVVDGVMYITIPWNRGVAIGDVLVSVGAPQDVYSPEFGC